MVSLKRDPNPGTTPASGSPTRGDMLNEIIDRFGAERFTANKVLASNADGLIVASTVADTDLARVGTGMTVSLSTDDTDRSATVPNTDTTVTGASYSLAANDYSEIVAVADIELITGVLSTPQNVTIIIKIGATTKSVVVPVVGAVFNHSFTLRISATQITSTTVVVSHGAAAADANTTTHVRALYVHGIT